MKAFLPTLIALSSLLSVVSCGSGGQSSASLQVSRAFAMTNPNFGGGLIIAGKNLSTGKTFSKGLTTSMSLNIVLDKGTWLITATGWDGGSPSNVPFGGLPYCGKVTKDLSNDNETIDLSVTTAECATSFFSGAHADTAASTIKTLSLINTCNTFYDGNVFPTDVISSSVVSSGSATDSFCENIANDLQTKVESVKIYALNKDIKSTEPTLGFPSGCIKASTLKSRIETGSSSPANPYQSGKELKLPVGGIPFYIVTYRDNSCAEPIARYPFKNGLGAGNPEEFDHLLLARNSSDIKLVLPGNDMRRGYTPFQAIMPFFKRYNSGTFQKFLTAPATVGTYKFHGIISQPNSVILDNVNTCSTVTNDGTYVTSASCTDLGDEVQISFTGSTEGTGSFTMNSISYGVYMANATFGQSRYSIQRLSMELLGHDGDENIKRFYDLKNHDNDSYGALSIVRDIFSSHAAGGALGISNGANTFANECLARTADKEVSVFNWEKMQQETFRVVLSNSVIADPTSFTCNNTSTDESDCFTNGEIFEKRMVIYDYRVSAATPSFAMEFNCTTKLGKLEMNIVDIEGAKKDEVKQIVNWNTDEASNLQYQRFERLLIGKQYKDVGSNTWIQIGEHRQMARVMKTGTDDYEAWAFSFNTHKNGSSFDQAIAYQRLKTASTTNLNYINTTAGMNHSNPYEILTDSANSILLARSPTSESGDNIFSPANVFPQGSGGTSATFNALSTDFATADNFNDSVSFNIATLNTNAFNVNMFGTSFLTTVP